MSEATRYHYAVYLKKSDEPVTKTELSHGNDEGRRHPDDVSVAFTGVGCEDPTRSVEIFNVDTKETTSDVKSSESGFPATHFAFLSPPPLDPKTPVIEYLTMTLKPDSVFDGFVEGFNTASRFVLATPGCTGSAISQQTNDPSKVLIIVGWQRFEDHTEGLPRSAGFSQFREEMGAVLDRYVVGSWGGLDMSHFRTSTPAGDV